MNQNKKQLQREQKGWMPKDWIYKTTLGPIRGVTDDSKGEVARWAYRPDLFRSFYSFFMSYLAKEIVEAEINSPGVGRARSDPKTIIINNSIGNSNKKDIRTFGTNMPLVPDIKDIKVTLGP